MQLCRGAIPVPRRNVPSLTPLHSAATKQDRQQTKRLAIDYNLYTSAYVTDCFYNIITQNKSRKRTGNFGKLVPRANALTPGPG